MEGAPASARQVPSVERRFSNRPRNRDGDTPFLGGPGRYSLRGETNVSRVLALLDKPSAGSFGMTPIVVEHEGRVSVLGLAPPSVHRGRSLTAGEVEELIRGGHALGIS